MTYTIEQGSDAWHAERRLGIGGSDAAAALGLSKWATPYQLYLEKIGEAEPKDETWEMAVGKALEPKLRQHYSDTTGRAVLMPAGALVSEQHPFMRYNPDGLTEDGRLLEFKTALRNHDLDPTERWGEEGTDEIPKSYLIQVQHGMIVTGRVVCDVSVSIGSERPRYYHVLADRELQEMIVAGERSFWHQVENRIPPAPTSLDDVAKYYRHAVSASVLATPAIEELLSNLRIARDNIRGAEEQKTELEMQIKMFMGEYDTLIGLNGLPLATWRGQAGARRVNADLLRKLHPSVAAEVTEQGEPSRRFLLK